MEKRNLVEVTIVGFGNYGRMICQKYAQNPFVQIKSILTPHTNTDEITFTKNLPVLRSPEEWKKRFGQVHEMDVFDLCVHEEILQKVLSGLVSIGAKNFILPKPIAVNSEGLAWIEELIKRNNLNVVIASQWHYTKITEELRDAAKKAGKIKRIKINFSHFFGEDRIRKYTPLTAFIPHVFQILHSAELVSLEHTNFVVKSFSPQSFAAIGHDTGGLSEIEINIKIDAKRKSQKAEIYFESSKMLEADFSGIFEYGTFLEYPFLYDNNRITPIIEEPLVAMIGKIVDHFAYGPNDKQAMMALSFDEYLPVARKVVEIIKQADKAKKNLIEEDTQPTQKVARIGQGQKSIAIIGGGIFGALSAIELAKKGFLVTIFEKNCDMLLGASLVNQCRLHMGYHYPRDKETAKIANDAQKEFRKLFPEMVPDDDFENFYCIAKEGSLTTAEEFESFCKNMKLPFERSWPKRITLSKDKIALCFKVPEQIFDVRLLRRSLHKLLENCKNVRLMLSCEVVSLDKTDNSDFKIDYCWQKHVSSEKFDAVINATYSKVNWINKMCGIPVQNYQYELCEMPVISTPWKNTGLAVMDGPFFGVMPFGFSKEYLLYDVELSVLEHTIAPIAKFKHSIAEYNEPTAKSERFKKYVEKMKGVIPEVESCKYLYSLYTIRIVLPHKERTDTRPTIIQNPVPGFWYVFSGKFATSALFSVELAGKVEEFFQKEREHSSSHPAFKKIL